MANIKSAEKRARIAVKRTLRNKTHKSRLRTAIKRFHTDLLKGDKEQAAASLRNAYKVIDTVAAKGIIHKNAAARKKSRLTKRFNKAM